GDADADLFERPVIITDNAYGFMVLEQLAEIGLEADVLLEPMRRDSGPAIAAGAAFAETRDKDAIVLALAADHMVSDTPAFLAACREGLAAAEAGHIVTFGVQPERAATEYGYINPGEAISGKVRAVAKFVEKPDPATAAGYVAAGYLWNSGNFMFRAAVLTDEYRKVDAGSVQAVTDAVAKAGADLGFLKLDEAALEGVYDLVVVATQDAVLVSRQQDANGLKRLVAKLKTVAPQLTEDHIKVHRPWGSYQSVDNGDRHQVKRIIVKPGGRLSLQK